MRDQHESKMSDARMNDNLHEQLGTANASRDEGICDDQSSCDLVGGGWGVRLRAPRTGVEAQQYRRLSKGQRGIVRSFLAKVTVLSQSQLTRLIRRWMDTRRIERKPTRRTWRSTPGSQPKMAGRTRLASVLRWNCSSFGFSRSTTSIPTSRSRCPPRRAVLQFLSPTSPCRAAGWQFTSTAPLSTPARISAGTATSATNSAPANHPGALRN